MPICATQCEPVPIGAFGKKYSKNKIKFLTNPADVVITNSIFTITFVKEWSYGCNDSDTDSKEIANGRH